MHFLIKWFPPDLDPGPLAFLTVSNEDVGRGGQGKENNTDALEFIRSKACSGQRGSQCLLSRTVFKIISWDLENKAMEWKYQRSVGKTATECFNAF